MAGAGVVVEGEAIMASFWHEFENGMRNGESQAMKEEEERVVDRSWFAKPQSEAGLGDSG